MGPAMQENGVLKLVHPGGFVEYHTKPITAAQVMMKNPRHCVTRPDVFKFPWIVVRPDSVLKLGKVYFVVPNHTIHRLLRAAAAARRQPSLLRCGLRQQSRVGDQWPELTPDLQQSSYESWSGTNTNNIDHRRIKQPREAVSSTKVIPKIQGYDQRVATQVPIKSSSEKVGKKEILGENLKKRPKPASCFMITPLLQDHNQHSKGKPLVKRCNKETPKQLLLDQRPFKRSLDNPWHEETKQQQEGIQSKEQFDFEKNKYQLGLVLTSKQDSGEPKLKPCLRKPGSKIRRSQGLKVTFLLPSVDEKKQ